MGVNLLGGVHLKKCKQNPELKDILEVSAPDVYSVPVLNTKGFEEEVCVSIGEQVKEGTLIAKPKQQKGTFVYSPASGKIVNIVEKFTPTGLRCPHVVIMPDNKHDVHTFPEMPNKTSKELLKRLAISGIVDANLGGAPTYLRYSLNAIEKKFDLYVVVSNTDPYLSANEALVLHRTAEVVGGAKYFAQLLASKQIVFVLSNNKRHLKKVLKEYLKKNEPQLKYSIKEISNNYPYDNLALLNARFRDKRNPLVEKNYKKAFVEDAITCYAFFNSVEFNRPINFRVITVSGNGINKSGNYIVKHGTSFEHILSYVDANKTDKQIKILNGGIMSGLSQHSTDVCSNSETLSVTVIEDNGQSNNEESPCINCGRCAQVCPMNLLPNKLDEFCVARKNYDAERYGIKDCIECGCCSFVCPAKRYISQRIGAIKSHINKEEK